jgi:outer membrane lipoprotein carrier protein
VWNCFRAFDASRGRRAAPKKDKTPHHPLHSQGTRPALLSRQSIVNRFAAVSALLCVCVLPLLPKQDSDLDTLLHKVENRYNHAKSLKLDFSEVYAGMRRPAQKESGVLYLLKPSRMRWEYTTPKGKVFLSDGKEVYLYTPGDAQAQKSKLKDSEDMHAPVAFLLGKLDFTKEFKSFEIRKEGSATWIVAQAKSPNLAYTKVEFQATPDGEIHQVDVTGQDQSKLDFIFSNEELNPPVAASLFTFHPPPGVQVLEAQQ